MKFYRVIAAVLVSVAFLFASATSVQAYSNHSVVIKHSVAHHVVAKSCRQVPLARTSAHDGLVLRPAVTQISATKVTFVNCSTVGMQCWARDNGAYKPAYHLAVLPRAQRTITVDSHRTLHWGCSSIRGQQRYHGRV